MKIQTFIFNWRGQYEKTKEKQKQLSAIGVVPVVINSDDNHREDNPNWHNIGEESYFTAQFLKSTQNPLKVSGKRRCHMKIKKYFC